MSTNWNDALRTSEQSESRCLLNVRLATWRQCLHACVPAGGRHFEHTMWRTYYTFDYFWDNNCQSCHLWCYTYFRWSGHFSVILLSVPFETFLPIFIEIGSYLTDTELNINWHVFETRCIYVIIVQCRSRSWILAHMKRPYVIFY